MIQGDQFGRANESDELYSNFKSMSMAELDAELQQAVENEDYEKASLLRDEIRKRK